MPRALPTLLSLAMLAGCTPRSDIFIDLRTDWVPERELTWVDVWVTGLDVEDDRALPRRTVDSGEALLDGVRVGEALGLEHGRYELRVRLYDPSELVLAEPHLLVTVEGDQAVTVLSTRSCANVGCGAGETCLGGECVPAGCTPENPAACPPAECTIDLDCGGEFSECGTGACVEGRCFARARDDACDSGDVCAPYDGCIPERCATPRSTVVANWDVVPEQTITTPFEIGALAFHEHGSRVRFSVDGREVAVSDAPVPNPRTGVAEHVLTLEPGVYADGRLVVSAVAEPQCPGHDARALRDLVLFLNDGGAVDGGEAWVDCAAGDDAGAGTEMAPFATIDRALDTVGPNGFVYLTPGDCYEVPTEDHGERRPWTTIQPLTGAPAGSVQLLARTPDARRRISTSGLRFADVQIVAEGGEAYFGALDIAPGTLLWLDGVELWDRGLGRAGAGQLSHGSRVYLTDGYIHDLQTAAPRFVRGTRFERVGGTLRLGTNTVAVDVETSVGDGSRASLLGGYYPDGFVQNVIVYNTRAIGMGPQSFFGISGRTRDVAVVNTLIETDPGGTGSAQLFGGWEHALFWHMTIVGTGLQIRGDVPQNAWLENGLFGQVSQDEDSTGWLIRNNHYASLPWHERVAGQDIGVGDPGFLDRDADDFRVGDNSPAATRGRDLPDVPYDIDGAPWGGAARGVGAYAPVTP